MKSLRAIILMSFVFFVIGCAQTTGYKKYGIDKSEEEINKSSPDEIQFYVSNLSLVEPYNHLFPTGVKTEAPNLDPRSFCSPDSIRIRCIQTSAISDSSNVLVALPGKIYEIIGEVEIFLSVIENHNRDNRDKNTIGESDVIGSMGPHKKLYVGLSDVDWQSGFDKLRISASEMGADAVVELYCGRGVRSNWVSPTTGIIPTYGSSGYMSGVYSYSTPGGMKLSGWSISGLAIKWKE